mmetsp:Transcript_9781/g.17875  ORF Transcript_9781/g.17875 Transcript_9781/m.17875 type:complete len:235 (-) Transcript_9781:363-1067(-)
MKYCISKQKKLDSPFFRPTPFLYSAVCIAIDHHCHLPQSVSFLPTCVASTSSRIPVRLNTNKRYDTDGVRHTFEHTEYITPTQTALLLNLLVLLHTFGLTTDFTVGLVDKAADRNRLSAVTNLTRLDLLASEMAWISFKIKSSAISPSSRWTMRNKGPSMTSDLSVSPFRPSKTRTTFREIARRKTEGRERDGDSQQSQTKEKKRKRAQQILIVSCPCPYNVLRSYLVQPPLWQ